MLDTQKIRKDFPILSRTVHGKPLVYLDNAATTQKPLAVMQALNDFYSRTNANVHRGVHALSEEATEAYETARTKVAAFLNAKGPQEIVFTRNATEAINLVAHGWGRKNVKAGDEVVLSRMEHHSNLVPWQLLAQEKGAKLRFIELTPEGELDMDSFKSLLSSKTRLVAVTQMSNVLGTINPVREIAALAHAQGAVVLVDGAQSVPHLPVDVQALGADFLAFSGHKMMAPMGIGVLWGREGILKAMDPFNGGGEMILEVTWEKATWNEIPYKFEAGTPNVGGAVALGAAVDYLTKLGMDQVREHEAAITEYGMGVLSKLEGLEIYGPKNAKKRGGVIAFNYRGLHAHDLGQVLDQEGVAVRVGHHCAQPLLRLLGQNSTARASFYVYNTDEEVDKLAEALKKARDYFGAVRSAR